MDTTLIGRRAARALAVALLACAAASGLAACQTTQPAGPQPAPIVAPQRGPDQYLIDTYRGRPVDRIEEELRRQVGEGQRPSSACLRHAVVEHPHGGYHLVCAQPVE